MTGTIAGVVLAGGRSRRMGGGDKGLVMLGGGPMLARIVKRLAPQVTTLALNANGAPERFAGFGLPVIADSIGDHAGPLAGIHAGLQWAADLPGVTHIVTVASDTPFLPTDLVARLRAANDGSESRIVHVATEEGRHHPVIGLWPVSLAAALEASLAAGMARVREFIDRHEHRIASFPLIEGAGGRIDPFFNVNSPADLERVQQILAEEE